MDRRFLGGFIVAGLIALLSFRPTWAFDAEKLAPIGQIVEAQIQAGNLPGAVVLVGHQDKVVYQRAFGLRRLQPAQPMTLDTIFDLASLTKPVVTTTAILQLVEQERLQLDAPVARYWREFGANGKSAITLRQLLTHTSGLPAGLPLNKSWRGRNAAYELILHLKPQIAPGTGLIYSDVNFIVLGELVRRVSGQSLDLYAKAHVFRPLGMKDSRFFTQPPQTDSSLANRLAPTGFLQGYLRLGTVHDPLAWRMGGVAGHAGFFGTAADLSRFAQSLLHGGSPVLGAASMALIETPQVSPLVATSRNSLRTLGWRADPPLAANRDQLPPVGAIGHNGYTGTSLWIDPVSKTWVVILSNRVHPAEKGDAAPLRERVAAIVAEAVGPMDFDQAVASNGALAAYANLPPRHRSGGGVLSGIDVLVNENFAPLAGLRIGLITHQGGIDKAGRRTIDLLRRAPNVRLVALFSPEHGLEGKLDEKVPSGTDAASGLPVHSLYGKTRRPTPEMLSGLDALVFDLQDAGVRFYTYISTMGYAMEAASQQGLRFFVLDRPDPINAVMVQGPMLDPELRSFTAYFPLPVRHGMTVGELARLFADQQQLKLQPEIIRMKDYQRDLWMDRTGLPFVPPSPNLRNMTAMALYPALGMIEGANISVGRGTPWPFEVLGAPWIQGEALAAELNHRQIPGARFEAARFTPQSNVYAGKGCQGVRLHLEDRSLLETSRLGLELADALLRLYPGRFELERTLGSIGSRTVLESLRRGEAVTDIVASWQGELLKFRDLREKYRLY